MVDYTSDFYSVYIFSMFLDILITYFVQLYDKCNFMTSAIFMLHTFLFFAHFSFRGI